jgi:hypothetical protein
MENRDKTDDQLRALVRSVGRGIPPALEERIRAESESPRQRSRKRFFHRPLLLLSSLSGAAALVLAAWLMLPKFQHNESPQIAEIRTQFVIADKNITIIFIQRPDFPVFLTAF